MTGRAALFLDRDGVVCRAAVRDGKPFPARSLQELDVLPGVEKALHKAGALGLVRIIVTNQPDVARGTLARQVVEAMHAGCRTVWIDCGYDELGPPTAPDYRCHDLAEAVEWIGARKQG